MTDTLVASPSAPSETASAWKRISFVWRYLRTYPRNLAVGVASLIGRDGVAFTIPLLIREGVRALAGDRHFFGGSVLLIATAIVGIALVRTGFQTLSRLNLIGTSRNVEYELRGDLLEHLFRLDAPFWERTRIGDVMASATNDLNAVRMMLGPGLTSAFESLIGIPVAVIVLASVNRRLTLAAFLPAPLAVLLLMRFGHIVRIRFERIQGQFSVMSAAVQQTIAGARVVRSFVREREEQGRFEEMNLRYVRANCILGVYSSTLDPLLTFITGVSVLIVLWYGGWLVLSSRLDVGDFVLFTTYMAMLVRPISNLGRVITIMQRGMASVQRLMLLFTETPRIDPEPWLEKSSERCEDLSLDAGSISLREVSLTYGDVKVLDGIDLDIPAGTTLAILGETGSGKTSLVRLITRTIDPTSGSLTCSDVDLRELPLTRLRAKLSIVPQETFLFSMTIADNIAIGVEDATREEILEAARIAGLEPDLEALPADLETVVGERGVMLSGGQKQRIAIARAILRNPQILILDDALSSVDSVTEQRILGHLRGLLENRTTILVTHRTATARNADRIILLHGGKVVEHGTHDQLMALNRKYARLAQLQVLEEELEVL